MGTEQENLHPQVLAETAALTEDEPENEQVDPTFQVNAPKAISFNLDSLDAPGPNTPHSIEDEEHHQVDNVFAEFLKHHHKFNHCSPRFIQQLAHSGFPQMAGPVPHSCVLCLPQWQSNQVPLAH